MEDSSKSLKLGEGAAILLEWWNNIIGTRGVINTMPDLIEKRSQTSTVTILTGKEVDDCMHSKLVSVRMRNKVEDHEGNFSK